MAISAKDRAIIRDVAKRIAEIAAHPRQKKTADLWRRLNNLERVRPMIILQDGTLHETSWKTGNLLKCEGEEARGIEHGLRAHVYHWEHLRDDSLWDDIVRCPIAIECTGWGIAQKDDRPDHVFGARHFNCNLADTDEPTLIPDPVVTVDWEETERRHQRLAELYDGIFTIERIGVPGHWYDPLDSFITWRGIEETFLDMIDRPQWLHGWLERMCQNYLSRLDQYEKLNLLTLNNRNQNYGIGPGGLGYTDLLPQKDFDGVHVRTIDQWGHATTQIFSEVSPAMHEEFALKYEKRFLARFGLASYGCCEPLDLKVDLIRKHVPHLRRVSMSPKANVARGAAACRNEVIFSYKPNPTIIGMEAWDRDLARAELRDAFEKTRGCVVEVIMKDLHSCRNQPHRMSEWVDMAMLLAEEFAE